MATVRPSATVSAAYSRGTAQSGRRGRSRRGVVALARRRARDQGTISEHGCAGWLDVGALNQQSCRGIRGWTPDRIWSPRLTREDAHSDARRREDRWRSCFPTSRLAGSPALSGSCVCLGNRGRRRLQRPTSDVGGVDEVVLQQPVEPGGRRAVAVDYMPDRHRRAVGQDDGGPGDARRWRLLHHGCAGCWPGCGCTGISSSAGSLSGSLEAE